MTDDGTTAGGCWIYAGIYAGGQNMAARRKPRDEQDETAAEWAWAWPANRRILYNRASAAPDGTPWSERKKFVWWDEESGKWTGKDVPDFPIDRAPSARSDQAHGGPANLDGDDPFIMQADGKGWLFAPSGMIDGPMPTHYEPQESTVANPLYDQQSSPTRLVMRREDNLSAPGAGNPGSEVYPYVFTTYRLTEHHTAGGMSRWLPYLSELQPEMFCEISPELAAEVGLEPYGWATLVSPRAAIEARVLVTRRMTPLTIGGKTIHQIGLPYHWGVGGDATVEGDSANDLLGVTMDPNVFIQNSKYVAGTIMPGRRPRGPELVDFVEKYQREAGLSPESGNQLVTVSDDVVAASLPLVLRPQGRASAPRWRLRRGCQPPGAPSDAEVDRQCRRLRVEVRVRSPTRRYPRSDRHAADRDSGARTARMTGTRPTVIRTVAISVRMRTALRRATSARVHVTSAAERTSLLTTIRWTIEETRRRTDVDFDCRERRRCGRALARLRARAQRVLHRYVDLHRLQGLRGRLQGVEQQSAGRDVRTPRLLLRQHGQPRRQHVATRRLHRTGLGADRSRPRIRTETRQPRHADDPTPHGRDPQARSRSVAHWAPQSPVPTGPVPLVVVCRRHRRWASTCWHPEP